MANFKNPRVILKHDIEANWDKAVNFIPQLGELIIYDPDENYNFVRFKFGNGVDIPKNLPFTSQQVQINSWGEDD